jgi:hypothetical protein
MGNFADAGTARKSLADNKFTYTQRVKGEGAKTKTFARTDDYLNGYASVAAFLCNSPSFEAALERVSGRLWDAYCRFAPHTRNKFTRALNKVAADKGFVFQDRFKADTSKAKPIGIKLVGGDPQLGYMLRNRLFWKDSMDLRHGEHSHSLQWLAIAEGLPNLPVAAADLYAESGNFRAASDQDDKTDRSILMWQWIADCFPSDMKSLAARFKHSEETLESQSYRSPQVITDLLLKSRGGPIPGHFVSTYLFHRYKNRSWLTMKQEWNKQGECVESIDKLYTKDPKVMRDGSYGAQTWKKSTAVPEARLLRDPAQYSGMHTGAAAQSYELVFHNKPGTLCYYYSE